MPKPASEESQINSFSIRWLAAQKDLSLEVIFDAEKDFSLIHPTELPDPTEFLKQN